MKETFSFILALVIACFAFTAEAGILATQESVFNGKKNLADPAFLSAAEGTDGLASSIKSLLTDSLPVAHNAKTEILRAVVTATGQIQSARGVYSDVSAQKLYDALVMYDLLSDKNIFSDTELASLRGSFKSILYHYRSPENFIWDDDRWCLGATAMRLVACEILYSFNFSDDPEADSIRTHAMRYLAKNLNESIDADGGWLPDPEGAANDAVEYIIITAKALKNAGILDVFNDPRLLDLLKSRIWIMPPQNSEFTRNTFLSPSNGETPINMNPASRTILAAMDIVPIDPELASGLVWHWNRCGKPVNDLGILFIDTTIAPLEPALDSALTGGGSAVFRYNFGMSIESWFYSDFGDEKHFPDRNGLFHADSGDFSFIWNGNPLVLHNSFYSDDTAKRLAGSAAWRHSLVLDPGSGDKPVRSQAFSKIPAPVRQENGLGPGDFYANGIRQFISFGPVDYVSGDVRNGKARLCRVRTSGTRCFSNRMPLLSGIRSTRHGRWNGTCGLPPPTPGSRAMCFMSTAQTTSTCRPILSVTACSIQARKMRRPNVTGTGPFYSEPSTVRDRYMRSL